MVLGLSPKVSWCGGSEPGSLERGPGEAFLGRAGVDQVVKPAGPERESKGAGVLSEAEAGRLPAEGRG